MHEGLINIERLPRSARHQRGRNVISLAFSAVICERDSCSADVSPSIPVDFTFPLLSELFFFSLPAGRLTPACLFPGFTGHDGSSGGRRGSVLLLPSPAASSPSERPGAGVRGRQHLPRGGAVRGPGGSRQHLLLQPQRSSKC